MQLPRYGIILFGTIFLFSFFSAVPLANAMCPLCVVGAAAGLGIARYYGIDDSIAGIWLGALAVSSALWISRLVNSRYKGHLPFQGLFVASVVIFATISPFYFAGFFRGMQYMNDSILGVNRVLFGVIVGGAITYLGSPISNFIKKKRNSAVPYQTIIITLSSLALLSLLLWYVTGHYNLV